MKFTLFGFSQHLMIEKNISLYDAVILRFIIDFYHTGQMKKMTVAGKEYIWVSYQYVSDNLPILHVNYKSTTNRANKKRITDCIDSLEKSGVIEKYIQKDEQGTFVYIQIVSNIYNQLITGVTTTKVTGYHHDGNGVTTTKVTKDSSISNKSIISNGGNGINEKIPPDFLDVKNYCLERKNNIDPQNFLDSYEARGWMIGKNKMKSWKACIRTWEQNDKQEPQKTMYAIFEDD